MRKRESGKPTGAPEPHPSVSDSGSEGDGDGKVKLALEAYKLASLTQTVLNQVDPTEAKKYSSRLAFILRNIQETLQESQLRIVPLEGVPFDEGLAISAVNLSEFDSRDDLIIDRVLEPLIMGSQGIVHSGIVSLRKKES